MDPVVSAWIKVCAPRIAEDILKMKQAGLLDQDESEVKQTESEVINDARKKQV